MLRCVMDDCALKIRRRPRPQRSRSKDEQRPDPNYNARKRCCFRCVRSNAWKDQSPQRDDELRVIEDRQAERDKIDRADNPEPIFEFKPRSSTCHSSLVTRLPAIAFANVGHLFLVDLQVVVPRRAKRIENARRLEGFDAVRSEERRVGKEGRSRWSPY